MKFVETFLIFLMSIFEFEGKFYPGRIRPGRFEYPSLNGWMKVDEAVEKCESDFACGGFTFKGSFVTKDVLMEIYFFHIVKNATEWEKNQKAFRDFLSRYSFIFAKLSYLRKMIHSKIPLQYSYPYWSTYEVERNHVQLINRKIKSLSSTSTSKIKE